MDSRGGFKALRLPLDIIMGVRRSRVLTLGILTLTYSHFLAGASLTPIQCLLSLALL
jgi:hypothetical protein